MKRIGKRIAAWILTAVVLFLSLNPGGLPPLVSRAETVVLQNRYGMNLLDGRPFDFYGKSNRNGMWCYAVGDQPAFCLEPQKRMYSGSLGNLIWYDLAAGEIPPGMSAGQAELLYYSLAAGGSFEGAGTTISAGGYAMIQSAVWAIMSGQWTTMDDFIVNMDQICEHTVNAAVKQDVEAFLEQYYDLATYLCAEDAVPSFASRYPYNAPTYQLELHEDGSGSMTFETNGEWQQQELVYEVPEGWSYSYSGNKLTFTCTSGDFNSGLIRGYFPEGSAAAEHWYVPGRLAVIHPEGADASSKQSMVFLAGEKEPWSVYLRFGENEAGFAGGGDYEILYHLYEHQETFLRDYQIDLKKLCSETGKPLEHSGFAVLEEFDMSQLDGTNLEAEQFERDDQEGPFAHLAVCEEPVFTNDDGYLSHRDQKSYHYRKTYCGGHPEPVIHEIESDGEDDGETEAANAAIYEAAWAAWEECVSWCEANADFHSEAEGEAERMMEADRDEAFDTFINLKRIYTLKEVQAREGYILHGFHREDIPVEIVEFSSSQAGGEGEIIGEHQEERASIAVHPTELSYMPEAALASGSDSLEEEAAEEEQLPATPSQVLRAVWFSAEDEEGRGGWQWNGVLEPSPAEVIDQDAYEKDRLGYHFEVIDHRTEGEIHINKRDLDLYNQAGEEEKDETFGRSQGDATLEGAVYGLYAAEDIIHPDGKTGKVFSSGDLVSIASTDQEGNASFLCITEVTDTSKSVPNLHEENLVQNGNRWIGRPLLLGRYFVREISRSEGYELSQEGILLSQSNREAQGEILLQAGSAVAGALEHPANQWDGSWNDFTVTYYDTGKGFDIYVTGYPEQSSFFEVSEEKELYEERRITGSVLEEKKDASGNVIYKTAEGGEYKLDAEGKRIPRLDAGGNPVYSDQPERESFLATSRVGAYLKEGIREAGNSQKEEEKELDEAYIIQEVSNALYEWGYKPGLEGYPWKRISLDGMTNGEVIGEILDVCTEDVFWDAYALDSVYEEDGEWYAVLKYGYKAIANRNAVYDPLTGKLTVRKAEGYIVYEKGDYERSGLRFTVDRKEIPGEGMEAITVFQPEWEKYAAGELILDKEGNPVPEMVLRYLYEEQITEGKKEILTEMNDIVYDRETETHILHVSTRGQTFEEGPRTMRIRAQAPELVILVDGKEMEYADYVRQYKGASATALVPGKNPDKGSYVKEALLLYPGQTKVYQDRIFGMKEGTRREPLLVMERVIRQAVMVQKSIAEESYEDVNTYKIHKDPFTVLFGQYRDGSAAKTMKGFRFRCYLKSDLEATGLLLEDGRGRPDYEALFEDHGQEIAKLAVPWDIPRWDADRDLTTVHANERREGDNSTVYYYGTSVMLPYGTYVIQELQPEEFPNNSYEIDAPKEVQIPWVPQIGEDGTVYDDTPDPGYYYDAEMTPEQLVKQYHIRFNEETHQIRAHNNDGDFTVYKYGIRKEDEIRPYPNETVGEYYKYGISEAKGKEDSVYYSVYINRDMEIEGYGITRENVDNMSGSSTAVDRVYAPALVPWSVLEPRYGEIIDDEGNAGNRGPALEGGEFNFVAFAKQEMENTFYSSKLRIEKLDGETGENILHDGAYYRIYAASRDVDGDGNTGVKGSGRVLFDDDGNPVYDEKELITLKNEKGEKTGIFRALTTDGQGYIETFEPLGAGTYVLVEVKAPEGYVPSRPVAFEVYSDRTEYYPDGKDGGSRPAERYQYVRVVYPDGSCFTEDVHRILVVNEPIRTEFYKVEAESGSPVPKATLSIYKAFQVRKTKDHRYEGVKVVRNLFGDVTDILLEQTGKDWEIRETGFIYDDRLWDFTGEDCPSVSLWRFDMNYGDVEQDEETGIWYGLNERGARVCRVDEATGMAYTLDAEGNTFVWPLADGEKILLKTVALQGDGMYADVKAAYDSFGLPVSYDSFRVRWGDGEWISAAGAKPHELARVPAGDYILEETVVPLELGYIQALPLGFTVEEKEGTQVYTMENDYTRYQFSKQDLVTGQEIPGARLTLYYAERVYDESSRGYHLEILRNDDDSPRVFMSWITGAAPEYVERLPVGDYILEEVEVPYELGYVRSEPVEVFVSETGEVQKVIMKDDFTSFEVAKYDSETGRALGKENPAHLALYKARLDAEGNPVFDQDGLPEYDVLQPVARWTTDDGAAVRETGREIRDEAGNIYMEYDYEMRPVPSTKRGRMYVTEHGRMRFEYIPVGHYVLVEEQAPAGYASARPISVHVEDRGQQDAVMLISMEDRPLTLEISKVRVTGGKELTGASMALYEMKDNGERGELYEEWNSGFDGVYTKEDQRKGLIPDGFEVGDRKPHVIKYIPAGWYILREEKAPFGFVRATEIRFQVKDTGEVQRVEMKDEIAAGRVRIYKHDGENRELPLAGAVFLLKNLDTGGELRLETDERGEAQSDYMPIGELTEEGSLNTYTYTIQETEAPDGYFLNPRIHQFQFDYAGDLTPRVTYVYDASDEENQVRVSKKLLGSGEELPGARLTVTEKESGRVVDSWISGSQPHYINGISEGTYVLTEESTPGGGFAKAESIEFIVRNTMVEALELEMFDEHTTVTLEKVSHNTGNQIPGALLELRNQEGEVKALWRTEETPKNFYGLEPGTYTLTELEAPPSYKRAEPMTFTVTDSLKEQRFSLINYKLTNSGGDGPEEPKVPEEEPRYGLITARYYPELCGEGIFEQLAELLGLPKTGNTGGMGAAAGAALLLCFLLRHKKKLCLFLLVCLMSVPALTLEARAEEAPETIILDSEFYEEKGEIPVPAESYTDENGESFELQSWEIVPFTLSGRTEEAYGTVRYEAVEAGVRIPERASVKYEDEVTGKAGKKELPLLECTYENERWAEDFSFPVTFHSYQSDGYYLEGILIPHSEERPLLDGYEEILLASIGLDSASYVIHEIRWDGEAYVDADGILSRNALAFGRRKLWDCTAGYGGTVILPNVEGFRSQAVYRRAPEAEQTVWMSEQEVLPITVNPSENPGDRSVFWRLLRNTAVFVLAAGAVLLAAGVLLYLVLRLRKRRDKR